MSLYSKIGDVKAAVQAYKTPARSFDIRGEVIGKDKKSLRLRTEDGDRMDIVLKKDMDIQMGQTAVINRRDIESLRLFTKSREEAEIKNKDEEKKKLEELGVEDTEENRDSLGKLRRFGGDITKENIQALSSLERMLDSMRGYLSIEVLAEMRSKGIQAEEISLGELQQIVKEMKIAEPETIEAKMSRMKGRETISDSEAKKIAKELYRIEMGKDVADIIKALKKAGVEVSKENVDDLYDLFSKLHDIRDVKSETLWLALERKEEISIDLLYTMKNYIRSSFVAPAVAGAYEKAAVPLSEREILSLDGEIDRLLAEAGLGEAHKEIAKDLLRAGRELKTERMQEIFSLREAVAELQETLDKNTAALLLDAGKDILQEDVFDLLKQIKEIQAQTESAVLEPLSPSEKEGADILLEAVQGLSAESLLSEDRRLGALLKIEQKIRIRDLIFEVEAKERSLLSKQEIGLLRTASVLQSVHEISGFVDKDGQRQIRLLSIGQKSGLIPKDFQPQIIERKERDDLLEESLHEAAEEISASAVREHYRLLRKSLRASHVRAMIREGIDPMQTDIRLMNRYIQRYEAVQEKYSMHGLSAFERDELSIYLLKSGSGWKLGDFARYLDGVKGRSHLAEKVERLLEEAGKRDFPQVREKIGSAMQSLSQMGRGSKEEYESSLQYFYGQLKEAEDLIKASKREDKELFVRYMKEVGESIRESAKLSREDSMMQIPLFMGGEHGNANVFARSNKQGKKGIDPEDMSVLMDLQTKALGKIGFFLKVENKEIGLRISVSENVSALMKRELESLSHLLSSAGYDLRSVEITTEESGAKIAFTEEGAAQKASGRLDVRV
ncbi:MAG: DUF6240 domain-containing protein [Peptostreptococcaceae bacterium]|nr:DUF6240 domain-containing protein [Peptostreptococcaceae bacterium]